ncbi:MAG: response regulator [Proteobacteria bacterium]|nr:response regulator [Pseudomonadota bacterium]
MPDIKKTSILAVDDRIENLFILETLLRDSELNIIKATSGNEALSQLDKHDFALVLLDVQMPQMDGFETAEKIRASKKYKNLPIIFVTAVSTNNGFIFKGYEKGAVDYLIKPFEVSILRRKVSIFVELHKQRVSLENTTIELNRSLEILNEEISERKKIEKALKESEERHRILFETMLMGVIYQNSEGEVIAANSSSANILGVPFGEIKEYFPLKSEWGPIHENGLSFPVKDHPYSIAIGQGKRIDNKIMGFKSPNRDSVTWIRVSSIPLFHSDDSRPSQIYTLLEDITERKKAEESIRSSEKKYRSLFDTSRDGIFFIGLDDRVEDANPAFLNLVGYSLDEIKTMTFQQLTPSKWTLMEIDIDKNQIMKRGYSSEYEKEYIHKSGKLIPALVRKWLIRDEKGCPVRRLSLVRDISDKKKLEGELRQAHKMEAVGTLAGGIAHDFNNILAAIMGYIELIQLELADENPVQHSLDQVLRATHRAKDMVNHILTFSRQSTQEKKPIILQLIVNEALKLIRATIPTTIAIKSDIREIDGSVEADPTQIHQVIMNLCTNASHALAQKKGGVIDISLSQVNLTRKDVKTLTNLEPGLYARLSVKDNGVGMATDILGRIFDPYFTTKEIGTASGMGLSVVHGIVTSHNGAITVESIKSVGTTFHVYLPLSPYIVDRVHKEILPIEQGAERILFVDDEKNLAALGDKMLHRMGYHVTALTSSVDAFDIFSKAPDEFDLLITDMTMPDLTGIDLIEKIHAIRPELPVILCSGYDKRIAEKKLVSAGIRHFVLKPLQIRELGKTIRDALEIKK